ncbi:hypothetical protein [Catenovulum sediminis]|uniref:Uncharacterized protein n=1 Tax=Catenovulum sediminis TaxID=1740262 RepID=A0ABV1RBZ1_9ALTE
MSCTCCGEKLNSGMIHKKDPATGQKYKSCPHCTEANGSVHVYHPYPANYGQTPARVTARNPHGNQSYCIDCRSLKKGVQSNAYTRGTLCNSLV